MVRFRRITQFWNWLPAFRGVAEHESLQRAASALAVSPSALSRSVKLLEDALGHALFERHPTGMRTTPLGDELLNATRDAMRLVDDCVSAHAERVGRSEAVVVGATSELACLLVAASLPFEASSHPFELRRTSEDTIADDLLRGNVDAVVTAGTATVAAGLVAEPIGVVRQGVYASAKRARSDLEHARYVVTAGSPAPRGRVAVYADSLEMARRICERSALLCVLPDAVVRDARNLVRLGDAEDGPELAIVRRKPAGSSLEPLAIRAVMRSLTDALSPDPQSFGESERPLRDSRTVPRHTAAMVPAKKTRA
jgi:DNA-binding transcriptional LysR family regulator